MTSSSSSSSSPSPPSHSPWVRLISGGCASMTAEFCTFPVDTVKVRLQLLSSSHSMFSLFRQVLREEGMRSLYSGVKPALLRQSLYASIRMAAYAPIRDFLAAGDLAAGRPPAPWKMVLAGGSAALIGCFAANPTDILKIRMQGAGPNAEKWRSRGVLGAFAALACEKGLRGMWTGAAANMQRAFFVNGSELATYDFFKQSLLRSEMIGDHIGMHFSCSFLAGFVAAVVSSPFDVVKTRIMFQDPVSPKYNGVLDCMRKTVASEGAGALWKGFLPNWLRIGPWCVVMFITYEKILALAS